MQAASIRKSKRRIGALAVETSHRLHDTACCGPRATQGTCRRDSIVVVSVWPGLQGVHGHFATQVAVEPPNRTSTGPSEGGRFITRRNLPGHRLHRAESLFTSLQGSRRCPARHLATATSLLGRWILSADFRQRTARFVNTCVTTGLQYGRRFSSSTSSWRTRKRGYLMDMLPKLTGRRLIVGALFLIGFLLATGRAEAVPAFARKYGMVCTGCHEAWPVLNNVGREFRDSGYRFGLGRDNLITTHTSYFPLSLIAKPHYGYTKRTHQNTDQGLTDLKSGDVTWGAASLFMGGALTDRASFAAYLVDVPNLSPFIPELWVRFNNLMATSWLNFKLGDHEPDTPHSAIRSWSLFGTGFLIYGYHAPGSASLINLGFEKRGIEYFGHDRGGRNRVALSVFSQQGGAESAFDSPGAYLHASHEWVPDSNRVSAVQVGAFGLHSRLPTSFKTLSGAHVSGTGGDLRDSSKYGVEGHLWLGPLATPLHIVLVAARGADDRDLIPGASRAGTFSGGFVEIGYSPTLSTLGFARVDAIRNRQQADPSKEKTFDDQDAYTLGIRHTVEYTYRAEYALQAEYSIQKIKGTAVGGLDERIDRGFLGFDVAF